MISVTIPIFNVVRYLDYCVSSIVNQTFKDIEIILVDDGSTDGSQLLCDEWARKDNRIKVVLFNFRSIRPVILGCALNV